MARLYSRSARRLATKTKRRFFITTVIVILITYATIFWIFPSFVQGIGIVTGLFKQSKKAPANIAQNPLLAPPVLTIPNASTNNPEIEITGYAIPNSEVKIYLDDDLQDIIKISGDGTFTSKKILLRLGTNNIYGKAVDENGEESLPSKTIKLIYDNEKPLLEVHEPENGKNIQGERRLKISGKTEANAEVFVNDSRVITDSEGTFTTEYYLNDGENVIVVKSRDQATNTAEITRTVNFTP